MDENQLEAGQPVQVDEVNRIGLSSTRSRLFIDCADYQDEAVYSCIAENAFTRISSHTKLNLIRPAMATGSSENDLLAGLPMDLEPAMDLAAGNGQKQSGGDGEPEPAAKGLSAVAQCLSQRGTRPIGK